MPSSFRRGVAALVGVFLPLGPALAQDVIWSPPQPPATPPAVQEEQNSSPMQVFAPLEAAPPLPLQWGPVQLHPHVRYQFSYGNGLYSSPGHQHDSIVQRVSPGMLFNVGDHWILDYTPTLNFYSSSSFRNTVNQSVRLGWGMAYHDWFFSGSQSYASSSDPNIETASQTDRETYSTAFNASYQFNSKMSLDMGLNQMLYYVGNGSAATNYLQRLANSKSWSTMEWFNYQFWPRFNAGLGAGGGYTLQQNSPDSVNEQYQARANWRATDKISFQLSGGLEDRQYLSGGAGDLVTPIFGATVQYQPFDQTRLSVTASRTVSPATFQNQTTEGTAVRGDLNQRLLGRLFLDLSGGYSNSKYLASASGISASRNDNVYSFSARLSCPLRQRINLSVFYAYSDNSSTQSGFTSGSGFGYTSRQVGFEIGYRY
jgi:Putative beta-barrel porin 2